MGAKAIEIIYGASSAYLEAGDTLRSGRDRDLMDMAGSELDFFKQKFSRIADDLSRTLDNVNLLLEENATNISGTLGNLNSVSGDVAELLETEKEHLHSAVQNLSAFADMLGENAPRVDSIVGSLNEVTAQLAEADFARRLSESVATLDDLLGRIESGDGSLGLLLNDRALYDSLTMASGNLASLLADLQEYPGRYVHFSLFGRDPEKMKAKADRRAAREAGKQFKDSLRRAQ